MTACATPGLAPSKFEDTLPPDELIFGQTLRMRGIRERVIQIADSHIPLLICGESGTGKEIIAKLIHAKSRCHEGVFFKVHCPAISPALLESELFAFQERGYTRPSPAKPKQVQATRHGTLFLDEIGELEPDSQVTLLHVLQDGRTIRLGAQVCGLRNVRLVCATHRPLEREVQAGRFRHDLYFRIGVAEVNLPPLRERREDIPSLVRFFLELYGKKYNRLAKPLSAALLRRMLAYQWPGNVRELENSMNRYVALGSDESSLDDFDRKIEHPLALAGTINGNGSASLREIGHQAALAAERTAILQVLEANSGNRKKTAALLRISYRALLYKIKEVGIPPKREKVSKNS